MRGHHQIHQNIYPSPPFICFEDEEIYPRPYIEQLVICIVSSKRYIETFQFYVGQFFSGTALPTEYKTFLPQKQSHVVHP